MKKKRKLQLCDCEPLKRVAGWNFLLNALGIPISIAAASALSDAVSAVAEKQADSAASCIAQFAGFTILQLILTVVKKTIVARKNCQAEQTYRQSLYQRFMGGKLPLYKEEPAAYATVFRRDMKQITEYYTSVLPGFVTAAAGYICYLLYVCLALDGWLFAVCMTAFGLLSLLQPIILEKFLIRNFIAADQAESELTQQLIAGKEGFAAMKLLDLHGWFMEKYRQKQRGYWKAGIKASASGTFNNSMEDINRFLQTLGLVVILGAAILQKWTTFEAALQIYVLSGQVYAYLSTIFQIRQDSASCRAALQQIDKYLPEVGHKTPDEPNLPDAQILIARDLSYSINEKKLLENAGFALIPGDKCLLKGENGTGKSTLLSLILGETEPTGGEICLKEKPVAWCPQAAPQLNCTVSALYKAVSENTPEISENLLYKYADRLGLKKEEMKKAISQLSGGTRKKVILAMALAKQTQLLILDEPEAMLDQDAVKELLLILKEQNRAMLVVSHSPVFDGLADSVLWLKNRKLLKGECAHE